MPWSSLSRMVSKQGVEKLSVCGHLDGLEPIVKPTLRGRFLFSDASLLGRSDMVWEILHDRRLVFSALVVMLVFSILLFLFEMGDRDRLFRIAIAQQAEIQTQTAQVTELTGMVQELLQKLNEPTAPVFPFAEAETPFY